MESGVDHGLQFVAIDADVLPGLVQPHTHSAGRRLLWHLLVDSPIVVLVLIG